MDEEQAVVTAPRRFKRINRKTKTQVVFDEKARREFLTGFRKRKLERKQKAQERLKNQIKEEKKRIRLEAKEGHKKLTRSYEGIPELEERMAHLDKIHNSKVEVSILELDTDLLAKNNFIIGTNKVKYEETDDEGNEENGSNANSEPHFTTKKEIDKDTKKKAAKLIKKSKPIQQLNKLQQAQQRKKSKQKRKKIEISQNKKKKK